MSVDVDTDRLPHRLQRVSHSPTVIPIHEAGVHVLVHTCNTPTHTLHCGKKDKALETFASTCCTCVHTHAWIYSHTVTHMRECIIIQSHSFRNAFSHSHTDVGIYYHTVTHMREYFITRKRAHTCKMYATTILRDKDRETERVVIVVVPDCMHFHVIISVSDRQ